MTAQVTNTFLIEFDGQKLAADVDLNAVVVEDHLHLPDSFIVTFRDGSRTALARSGAKVGGKVKIAVLNDSAQSRSSRVK
jgi:hypothetical protein